MNHAGTVARAETAGVHAVPPVIEDQIARLALECSGGRIDTLSPAQLEYLRSWRSGPAV